MLRGVGIDLSMSSLRIKSLTDLPAAAQAHVRGPVAVDVAAGAAPRVSGSQAGAGEGGSTPGGNDPAARGENEVNLPWPPKILSPNARAHWAVKNRAVKLYRDNCAWLTKAAGVRVDWDGFVHVWITFCPPDRRHRDDDNCIGAFKHGRDGMAQALGIDDKRFRIHPFLSDEVVKGGAVKVRLSKGIEE